MVKHYKYLGVTLDNSLNLKMELHRKKQLDNALKLQKMRMNQMKLDKATRYHIW